MTELVDIEKTPTGFVKWRELIPILITIFSMSVAISMGAIYIHGEAPHRDAIPRTEFDRFADSVDNKLERVLNTLDRMQGIK